MEGRSDEERLLPTTWREKPQNSPRRRKPYTLISRTFALSDKAAMDPTTCMHVITMLAPYTPK